MKYNDKVRCAICGEIINMPKGRIEWSIKDSFIHIVHHVCSKGYNDPKACISDIIMDQSIYSSDLVYERLEELKRKYPENTLYIQNVIENLFSDNS